MEKQTYSLRTNIGYFLNRPIGYNRDFNLEYEEIFIEPDLRVKNLSSYVRFSRTREGLLLEANLFGKIEDTCGRCLEKFLVDVNTTFQELYVFSLRSQEETDLIIPDDGYIDLGSIFREYFILELPIKALCREDCKGLCSFCGKNLNESSCEHQY